MLGSRNVHRAPIGILRHLGSFYERLSQKGLNIPF